MKKTLVQGNIRAARGHVTFEENSRIEGTCYARRVTFKDGSNYIHHDYLEALAVDVACQDAVSYYEEYDPNAVIANKYKPQDKSLAPLSTITSVITEMDIMNYPNPFLNDTRFDYKLATAGHIKLVVMDLSGKVVSVLVDEYQEAGTYSVDFNAGQSLTQGIYFYSLITPTKTISKKMIKMLF